MIHSIIFLLGLLIFSFILMPGLNSKPFRNVEKAYNPVDSYSSVKTGGPLGAFREEQAMSQHRVSTSPFLSSSSHTAQYNIFTLHKHLYIQSL